MNVKVEIFDDRIEIESPGLLVKGMTIDDMKAGSSKPRNPMIAQLFQDAGKIEKWGSGIPRAIDEVREYGLPDLQFAERAGQVIATMYVEIEKPRAGVKVIGNSESVQVSDKMSASVRKVSEIILNYVRKNGHITSSIAAQLIDKSDRTARRELSQLVDVGLLEEQGETHTRVYKLK